MTLLSPIIAIAVAILAAVLMVRAYRADTRRLLQKQFAVSKGPDASCVPCKIRFPNTETATPCVVRATNEGWYMVTPEEISQRRHFLNNLPCLQQAVLIPWSSLEYGHAKFPMQNWLRFDVKSPRSVFFVERDSALKLLESAGRPMSAP
jgi:hypothetical protein